MKHQTNDNLDDSFHLKDAFSHDLSRLFTSSDHVAPELDERIVDQARQHFRASGRKQKFLRRLRLSTAAAAAVLLGVICFDYFNVPLQKAQVSVVIAREDIDRNGRVDILDALVLAKSIKSTSNINPEWDFNHDGQTNQADIDRIAFAAVRLKPEVL